MPGLVLLASELPGEAPESGHRAGQRVILGVPEQGAHEPYDHVTGAPAQSNGAERRQTHDSHPVHWAGMSHDRPPVSPEGQIRAADNQIPPIVGVAHVGYLPGDRILGLSKFARMVEFHARRPQTQERLTQDVARHLQDHLVPRGVGVVVEADHTCMSLRGARAGGTRTVTAALLGRLRDDPRSRAEFLSLTRSRA